MGNIMLTNSLINMKSKGFNLYKWLKEAKQHRPELTFIEFTRRIAYANVPLNAKYPQKEIFI